MELKNQHFIIEVNDNTGATDVIASTTDEKNFIIERSDWGIVDGYEAKLVEQGDNSVTVTFLNPHRKVEIKAEKRLDNGNYFETYRVTNLNENEFFLTKENFAIPLPFDCLYHPKRDILNDCSISHVWCGGDSAWLYAVRCNGKTPYLCMNVTRGAIDDYSIHCDLS